MGGSSRFSRGFESGSAGRPAWFWPLSDSGPAAALHGRQPFCTSQGIRPVRLLEINIGAVAYRAMWGYGVGPPSLWNPCTCLVRTPTVADELGRASWGDALPSGPPSRKTSSSDRSPPPARPASGRRTGSRIAGGSLSVISARNWQRAVPPDCTARCRGAARSLGAGAGDGRGVMGDGRALVILGRAAGAAAVAEGTGLSPAPGPAAAGSRQAARFQVRLRPTPASMPACGDAGCAGWRGGGHASG
jgi:hypothetical protein